MLEHKRQNKKAAVIKLPSIKRSHGDLRNINISFEPSLISVLTSAR